MLAQTTILTPINKFRRLNSIQKVKFRSQLRDVVGVVTSVYVLGSAGCCVSQGFAGPLVSCLLTAEGC